MIDFSKEFDSLLYELIGHKLDDKSTNELTQVDSDPVEEPRTFTLDKNSSNFLIKLHPEMKAAAVALLEDAFDEGIDLTITQGFRSSQEQKRLYDQGRTTPGPIVTNAKPGVSKHEYGLAFDVAPLNDKGKPHWPEDNELWNKIGELGKAIGLRWGGDFTSIKDRPHFEHPNANEIIYKGAQSDNYITKEANSKRINEEIRLLKLKLISDI